MQGKGNREDIGEKKGIGEGDRMYSYFKEGI